MQHIILLTSRTFLALHFILTQPFLKKYDYRYNSHVPILCLCSTNVLLNNTQLHCLSLLFSLTPVTAFAAPRFLLSVTPVGPAWARLRVGNEAELGANTFPPCG